MKIITLSVTFFLTVFCTHGQNLIGYNEKEIRTYIKEKHREMNLDNVINVKFKYLKYSDNSDNQTWLFFLNSDSICKSVRIICDMSMKEEKVKEFNSAYKKSGESKWIDTRDKKDYVIQIKNEEWSCIITIEPDK